MLQGKAVARGGTTTTSPPETESLSLESSPFGQLLKMLSSPVVHRSPLLMDKLLRLLSLISISLQVHRQRLWDKVSVGDKETLYSIASNDLKRLYLSFWQVHRLDIDT